MPQNLGANHPLQTPSTTTTLSSSAGPVNISFSFINDADVLVFLGGTLRTNGTGSDNYTINTAKTQVTFNNTVSGEVIITRKSDLLNKVRTFTPGSSVRAADLNTQFDQVMQLIQDNYELLRGVIQNDANNELTVGRTLLIKDDAVVTNSIADSSVTSAKIADGAIVNIDINANAQIDVNKLADGSARQLLQTAANGSDVEWTSNVDVPGTLDVTGVATFDGNIDANGDLDVDGTANLDNVDIDGTVHVQGTSTFVGQITASGGVSGNVTGNLTGNADTATDLAAATKIDASEQVAHTPNDTTYYTTSAADQRFWRQDAAGNEVIQTSATWTADDSRVATTGAIDARIVNLVTEVGGFVPIANETSFPATNPDINDGAGTIVSIGALASDLTFNGSGQATIANGAGTGNTVTINGGPASTTIASNSGALVETTTTLHTYTWHRTTPDGANVNTVANSIANVNTVAANIGDVNTLENNITDIQTLADIEDGTVATDAISNLGNIHANVTTCADNIADINTVANDLNEATSEIETVAASISNVDAVGGSIANVNTVAGDINNVNSFFQTYKVSSSAPGSPDAGDLWWDTSQNPQLLKAYDATNTQWIAVTTDQEAGLQTSGGTMTGALALEELGSQTAPTLTFDGDSNTGLFRGTADNVNITTGGETRLNINNTGLKATKPVEVEVTTATTNAVTTALTVESQSSGTPAAGIGVGMDFAVETAASNVEIGAQVEAVTTDVSSASEDVDLVVNLMAGGAAAAEKFRIASTGAVTAQGNIETVGGTVTTTGNTNLTLNPAGTGTVELGAATNISSGTLTVTSGDITSASNADIDIDPNGTGAVNLGAATNVTTGTFTVSSGDITSASNADIDIDPNGTGVINLGAATTVSSGALIVTEGTYQSGGNANITLEPGGTGQIQLEDNVLIGPDLPTTVNTRLNEDGSAVFNDNGASVDFRVESDTNANMLFVDGSTNRVGIGEAAPTEVLDVRGNIQAGDGGNLQLENDAETRIVSINADDATESYTVTLPPTAPTADEQVLRVASGTTDAELEWGTISQDVISTPQAAQNSRTFETGLNHLMAGTVTIASGQVYTLDGTAKLTIIG